MAFTKILGPGIATDTNVQVGVLTATKFYGDGSELDGITSAGLGTGVEANSLYGGAQIYYTNTVLSIGGTVTVDPPPSTNIAYTQYVDIAVEEGADLIIGDGDDLVSDILGIGTDGINPLPGNGGRVRADNFTNKAGTGAPTFPNGVNISGNVTITGIVTASSFSGTATYATTSGISTNVIGGISSVTQIQVTGVSTFTNGPVLVGSGTSTGTSSQRLQVTGGAYVSGSVGIGTTNPTTTIQVQGSSSVSDTRLQSVCEETTLINGNTASLVYNSGGGNIAICTNATGNITLAVTGIPTDSSFDNNSITFSVFSLNTGIARSCTALTLNGYNTTIRWAGGSLASAISGVTTTSGMDIYSFTGINTVGSASTTANYYILGVVNGGYR